MASKFLKESEVLELLYNSDDDSVSSIFSDSENSDNEIDNLAVADAIVNNDSDDEEILTVNKNFVWEDMENYHGHREQFSGDSGPRNGAENINDILGPFMLFFNKTIIDLIITETNRYAEQFQNIRGNLFSFRSPVRKWTPVTSSEIYIVLGQFILMSIVQKPTIRSYFSKRKVISTPGFSDVISRDRFEIISRFLHFIDNESLATYDGPQNYSKSILSYAL